MKSIFRTLITILILFVILFLVTRIFKKANQGMILSPAKAFYSKGNSPDTVRIEIVKLLRKFQDGYSKRDPSNVDAFMASLYSKENILILGTMPDEVFTGFEEATQLVRSDWESWGDCKFEIDSANISSAGNTAWFSTKGYVKFDLSRLLVLPLRLTGILVKEDQVWKFRQQQFQFDINFTFSLVATFVISAWILTCIIILIVKIIKLAR